MDSSTKKQVRELFAQVPKKHKEFVLQKLKDRPQNADKVEYLKGFLRPCVKP